MTDAFKKISPEDPVKYDFALTRLGIRNSLDEGNLLKELISDELSSDVGDFRSFYHNDKHVIM